MNNLSIISLLGDAPSPQGLLSQGNSDSSSAEDFLATLALAQPGLVISTNAQTLQSTQINSAQPEVSSTLPLLTTSGALRGTDGTGMTLATSPGAVFLLPDAPADGGTALATATQVQATKSDRNSPSVAGDSLTTDTVESDLLDLQLVISLLAKVGGSASVAESQIKNPDQELQTGQQPVVQNIATAVVSLEGVTPKPAKSGGSHQIDGDRETMTKFLGFGSGGGAVGKPATNADGGPATASSSAGNPRNQPTLSGHVQGSPSNTTSTEASATHPALLNLIKGLRVDPTREAATISDPRSSPQTATDIIRMTISEFGSEARPGSAELSPGEARPLGQVPLNMSALRPANLSPAAFAQHVGMEITKAVTSGRTDFMVRLDPPELGRIDVRMIIQTDGSVKAVLSTDNREAFNLLQRDSGTLERLLNDAGFKTDSNSLSFSLKQGDDGSGRNQLAWNHSDLDGSGTGDGQDAGEPGDDAIITNVIAREILSDSAVDIRV